MRAYGLLRRLCNRLGPTRYSSSNKTLVWATLFCQRGGYLKVDAPSDGDRPEPTPGVAGCRPAGSFPDGLYRLAVASLWTR
jgi:hypothetical protein